MSYFKNTFTTLLSVMLMTGYTTKGLQKTSIQVTTSNSVEAMSEKDIMLNGQHHRALSLSDYKRIYKKPERRIRVTTEEACTSNFEDNPNSEFYFNKGIKFEVSKNKVIVDEFKFTQGNYIIFKQQRLSKNTTLEVVSKIFPHAFSKLKKFNTPENGVMKCIALEETPNHSSDGKVLLFFKKNKLYMLQWWFPC
jgi:hypothetical protein